MTIRKSMELVLFALALAWTPSVYAQCSNATLRGNYAFTITGQILTGPFAGPVSGVALTNFDAKGGLTQVDHVLLNGVLPSEGWRPGSGTYSVNRNCTGTATINFTDGSPSIDLYLVVDKRGREIRQVVSDSGVATTALGVSRDSPL